MVGNPKLDIFMENFQNEALTFDDVSLVTQYADFLPHETSLNSPLSRRITLNIPFVSAAMDTVTGANMAIAMAMLGGIGVVHKNLSPRQQADVVSTVKNHLNGLIVNPVTFQNDLRLDQVLEAKRKKGYAFSGFPVLDENQILVGILTSKDIRFASDSSRPIHEIMTTNLVTSSPQTSLEEAYSIMLQNKIGKLPLIDKRGALTGIYSFTDVRMLIENRQPLYNRDSNYRLRAAAAVGPYDHERIEGLVDKHVDVLVVDTAHGHSKGVIETTSWVKSKYPDVDVIGGNIATAEAALELRDAGADAVKVGIGPGSICTTRVVTGVGVPQIRAIYDCAKVLEGDIPVIADGGIRNSGDVPKALVAGASTVMMGSILAGTEESPGEKVIYQGRQYVSYRGMGSLGAMHDGMGSRERYDQPHTKKEDLVPQGIEGMVPFAGSVKQVLTQFCGGLQSALGYCGTRSIADLQNAGQFIRISPAGMQEGHAHDITVTKEAPNYRHS